MVLAHNRDLRHLGEALLYLAPSLILFVAFVFVPPLRSMYLSLYADNGNGRDAWTSEQALSSAAEEITQSIDKYNKSTGR